MKFFIGNLILVFVLLDAFLMNASVADCELAYSGYNAYDISFGALIEVDSDGHFI